MMGRLGRFVGVGFVGFSTDAGLTELLVGAGLGPLPARAIAYLAAVGLTYLLNRHVTFRPGHAASAAEGGRYLVVNLVSAAVNTGCYAAALTLLPDLRPAAAVAIGSAVAMGVSYLGYSRLVFRPETESDQAAWRLAS